MSINSIDHDEMTNIANKWDVEAPEAMELQRSGKSAHARRRIEMLRDIRESGLSIEEAKELGLYH